MIVYVAYIDDGESPATILSVSRSMDGAKLLCEKSAGEKLSWESDEVNKLTFTTGWQHYWIEAKELMP